MPRSIFTSVKLVIIIFSLLPFSISGQEYKFVKNIPFSSSGSSQKAGSFAIDATGRIYLVDLVSKSILVYDENGSFSEKITKVKSERGDIMLLEPSALCLDAQNNLYIYDKSSGKIIKRPASGNGFEFGDKGSSLGQIRDITALAADSKGYIYAMNSTDEKIDIFYPDGTYLTWITGSTTPFENLLSIGVSAADELYVLDESGPNVYVYNSSGALVNTNRSVGERTNVKLKKPIDMAVLPNGDFIVIDEETCKSAHYNRIGVLIGTFGAKASVTGEGIFKEVSMIRASTSNPCKVGVFDPTQQQAQVFELAKFPPTELNNPKRLKLANATTTRKPAFDMVVAPNKNRYVIPADDHKKVVAYKDTSGVDVFTITGRIDDAICVATDSSSNLYVVDRSMDEVLVFDVNGALIRKFGKEIPDKLRDPVSIVVQKSGNIIVADYSRASLYMWNSKGVFQKIITSPDNSVIKAPMKIQRDSKDQLYVLDTDANCIYRVGSGGWPTAEKKLVARSLEPGEKAGVIKDFFVDPLDQIHLYNETSHQIEIYTWGVVPELQLSIGRPGNGVNGFEDIEKLLLDNETLHIYLTKKKGAGQKVYQYLVPPPKPEGSVTFDVVDGKLNMYFGKSKSPSVIAYGLLTPGFDGDSLAFKTTSNTFVVSQKPEDTELYHYSFVNISWSDYSEPGMSFDDYFSYAESMIHAQRYEEARGAWQIALEKTGRPMRMAEYIAKRAAELSQTLVKNYDIANAVNYAKYAHELQPNSKEYIANLGSVLKAQYRQFAFRNDIDAILFDVESHVKNAPLKTVVLNTVDSVSRVLALEENLVSINNAIKLQKRLLIWDNANAAFHESLASSYLELYKFKSLRETSSLELVTILDEVRQNSQAAYTGLKFTKQPYFSAHLTLLEAFNELGKFEEVQQEAAFELGSSSSFMSQDVVIRYRKELAKAFSGSGKHNNAIAEYNTILGFKSDNREVSELLVHELIAEKQYDLAKSTLQQLTIGNSENSAYSAEIGRIEMLKGNINEASFQMEKAIKQQPALLSYYGYLGEVYDQSGNREKALDYYEVAIEYLDVTITRTEQTSILKKDVKELKARLQQYILATANIYKEQQKYTEARNQYLRVTAMNANNAQAFFGLGDACRNSNRIYEAMDAYNRALSLDENNNTFINAYLNSVKLRDAALKSEAPLAIMNLEVPDVYPSLYKNYSENRKIPIGAAVISNNSEDPITPTSVTVLIPEYMKQPTSVKVTEIAAYSNYNLNLSALLPEQVLTQNDKRDLQMDVEMTYTFKGKVNTSKKSVTFVMHGRNSIIWSDKRHLASFVSPNLVSLVEYNKKADAIFRNSPTFGMNRTILKAMQLYTLLNK